VAINVRHPEGRDGRARFLAHDAAAHSRGQAEAGASGLLSSSPTQERCCWVKAGNARPDGQGETIAAFGRIAKVAAGLGRQG